MTASISAFEAAALLGTHPGLTPYDLYERLAGPPSAPLPAGLSWHLAPAAIEFAAEEHGWKTPVRRDYRETVSGLDAHARAYETADSNGPFVALFAHVADYIHRASWSKAGQAPEAYTIQANWTMMLSGHDRAAYVVLADRKIVIYWIQRDAPMTERLRKGISEMARRIAEKDPPAIDAGAAASETPATTVETPVDLDTLCMRYRVAQIQRAERNNAVQTADHAYEAAAGALKKALPPGEFHEIDGMRYYHNAKNGRLTEEKIDGRYF